MGGNHISYRRDIWVLFCRVFLIGALPALIVTAFCIWAAYARSVRNAAADFPVPECVLQHEALVKASVASESDSTAPATQPAGFAVYASVKDEYVQQGGDNSEWQKLIDAIRAMKDEHSWPNTPLIDKARELCSAEQEFITRIRELAGFEGPYYAEDSPGESGDGMLYLSYMVQILRIDAVYKARERRDDEALEDIQAIMRIRDEASLGYDVTAYLALIYINDVAQNAIIESFKPGALTSMKREQIIKQSRKCLNRDALKKSFEWVKHALKGEYATIDPALYGQVDSIFKRKKGFWGFVLRVYNKPRLDLDEAATLDAITNMTRLLDKPYYTIRDNLEQLKIEVNNMPSDRFYTKMYSNNCINAITTQACYEASIGLLETGLLIEQHIKENGAAPESLDFVGAAAIDPFTGKPFIYRPDGDTFKLYSLGPDQENDWGFWNADSWKDGDIPWRGNW